MMKRNRLSAAASRLALLLGSCLTTLLVVLPPSPASATPGDLDALDANVNGGSIDTIAVQPDGKILIAGGFTSVQGVARNRIARLNADGSLDATFDPKPNNSIQCLAVQSDGKILVGGSFIAFQPNGALGITFRNRFARLNPDGTVDATFDPNPNGLVNTVSVQADGKILVGGGFTSFQPNGAPSATARQYLARLNPDGTLDTPFDPKPNGTVSSLAIQEDGKIVLCGNFITFQPNGAPAATFIRRIARLNPDGTIDHSIDYSLDNILLCVALQANGKILLGGLFTTIQPIGAPSATIRNRIARLNANGTIDTAFDPNAQNYVDTIAVQADGKILIGGNFTSLQPNGAAAPTNQIYVARLHADGSLDTPFDPKPNGPVTGLAVQADGKVLIGGGYSTLQPNGAPSPTTRLYLARVLSDPATQLLEIPDGSQVSWLRGGAGPELSRAFFDLSTDGGTNWSLLGEATRVGATTDWTLSGLTLPGSGNLRARGVTSGGYVNGSQGLIEQTGAFSFITDPEIFPLHTK
ncbi:MAG: delta-60 repeat domain-containing protein, partial [Verrucomicrobiae bacterium]|nr:delta-60 repeat domain-containing protein [Verrucomicrobiae bacterium]